MTTSHYTEKIICVGPISISEARALIGFYDMSEPDPEPVHCPCCGKTVDEDPGELPYQRIPGTNLPMMVRRHGN